MGVRIDAGPRPERRLPVQTDDSAGPTEVPAREREHLASTGEGPCQLHGRVVRVGAADPEQDAVESLRGDPDEVLLEPDTLLADRR